MQKNNEAIVASKTQYLGSFAASISTLIFGLVTGAITARVLGPEGRGEFAGISYIAASSTGLVMTLVSSQALISQILEDKKAEDPNLIVLLMAILGIIVSQIFLLVFSDGMGNNSMLLTTIIVGILSFTQIIYNGFCTIQRGRGNFNVVSLSIISIPIIYLFGIISLYYLGLMTVNAILLINMLPIAIFGIYFYRASNSGLLISKNSVMPYIRSGHSFLYLSIMSFAIISVDRALLLRLSNLTELGYYSVASALTSPLIVIAETFVLISFIEVRSSENGVLVALSRFRIGQVVLIFFGTFLILFGPFLVKIIFGQEYINSIQTVKWLAITMIFRGLWLFLDNSLQAMKFKSLSFIISFIGLISIIFMGLIFVPREGSVGAAKAIFFGYIVMFTFEILIWKFILKVNYYDFFGFNSRTLSPLFSMIVLRIKIICSYVK